MKYKVIKLEDNKSVLVDESAEIKDNDYVYDTEAKYIRKLIFKHNETDFDVKIITTINHSIDLDVAMVVIENEVEKLACKLGYYNSSEDNKGNYTTKAFIAGYKTAQEKGSYSEEDLIKAMEASIEWWCAEISEKYGDIEIIEDFADIFIQSLKQEYIELEMETECCKKYTSCNMNCRYDKDTVWKIKTDRINGQLMCYTKKL